MNYDVWINQTLTHLKTVLDSSKNRFSREEKKNIFFSISFRNLVPTFLNTIYAHDPATSTLNLDPSTLKFANPMSVFYLENPSTELVNQVVEGANRLNADQVPEFVGLAATILKAYQAREDNHDNAERVCVNHLFYIDCFFPSH